MYFYVKNMSMLLYPVISKILTSFCDISLEMESFSPIAMILRMLYG